MVKRNRDCIWTVPDIVFRWSMPTVLHRKDPIHISGLANFIMGMQRMRLNSKEWITPQVGNKILTGGDSGLRIRIPDLGGTVPRTYASVPPGHQELVAGSRARADRSSRRLQRGKEGTRQWRQR